MTLMKSILLGSAAGIVAVASAQAADLPTRKAAPVEYVRVCNVGGITGWTLPGSDTCVKFSGYMTAHFIGGNLVEPVQFRLGAFDDLRCRRAQSVRRRRICPRSSWFRAAITERCPVFNGLTGKPLGITLPNQQNATFNRDSCGRLEHPRQSRL